MRTPLVDTDELTAKARIRNAAVVRFARDGFGASLRAIARDAKVSAAAVVKQFGSKDGLREACDDYVFRIIREAKRAAVVQEVHAPSGFIEQLAHASEYRPLAMYVLRSITEGGAAARAFIDHMVQDANAYIRDAVEQGAIRPSRDEEARTRFLIGASLGNLIIATTSAGPDEVDTDQFWTTYLQKMALPALELYTEGFFTDGTFLQTYLDYVPDPPDETVAT